MSRCWSGASTSSRPSTFVKLVGFHGQAGHEHQLRLQYSIVDARKPDRYPTDHFQFIVDKGCTQMPTLFSELLSSFEVEPGSLQSPEPGRFFLLVTYGSAPTACRISRTTCCPGKWNGFLPASPGAFCYVCTKLHPHELSSSARVPRRSTKKGELEKHEEVDIEWERRN